MKKIRIGNDIRLKVQLYFGNQLNTETTTTTTKVYTFEDVTRVIPGYEPKYYIPASLILPTIIDGVAYALEPLGTSGTARREFTEEELSQYYGLDVVDQIKSYNPKDKECVAMRDNVVLWISVKETTETTTPAAVNILGVRAFFINKTLKDKLIADYKKKRKFIGRFPIEPFLDEFLPTGYNIHSTGYHTYRVVLPNPYKGFGLHPDWKDVLPWKEYNVTKYQALVVNTKDAGTIIVDFPAEAQLYPGEYELLVMAKIFDPGYKNNARIVTMNVNKVFELVSDSEEEFDVDNAVMIEINNNVLPTQTADVYVLSGLYDFNSDTIQLDRNDGGRINIDISSLMDWYEGD